MQVMLQLPGFYIIQLHTNTYTVLERLENLSSQVYLLWRKSFIAIPFDEDDETHDIIPIYLSTYIYHSKRHHLAQTCEISSTWELLGNNSPDLNNLSCCAVATAANNAKYVCECVCVCVLCAHLYTCDFICNIFVFCVCMRARCVQLHGFEKKKTNTIRTNVYGKRNDLVLNAIPSVKHFIIVCAVHMQGCHSDPAVNTRSVCICENLYVHVSVQKALTHLVSRVPRVLALNHFVLTVTSECSPNHLSSRIKSFVKARARAFSLSLLLCLFRTHTNLNVSHVHAWSTP